MTQQFGNGVIVSGNPHYGLAKSISDKWPEARFYSRSHNDCNFGSEEAQRRFVADSLKYETYISCSSLGQFLQTRILEQVYRAWTTEKKSGQIIVIGSSADTPTKGTEWIYPIEKKALKHYCRNLSMVSAGHENQPGNGIRITYLSTGHLDTPRTQDKYPRASKIECDYVASVIDWILQQPVAVNINEMSIDPIQMGT